MYLTSKLYESIYVVIVTGGRHYADRLRVFHVLDQIGPLRIVQGGASGADRWAREYANEHQIELSTFPYRSELGKRGGPIRNQAMIDAYPDATLVVFPGGTGTADCRRRAVRAGMNILDAEPYQLKGE